jgi:hypothetical protein
MTEDDLDAFAIYVPKNQAPIVPDVDPSVPGAPEAPEGPDVVNPEAGSPIVPGVDPSVPGAPEAPEGPNVVNPAPGTPIVPGMGGTTPDVPDAPEAWNSKLYADIDFLTGYMGDAYGKVNLEFVGDNASVNTVEVTLNGVTKTVPALTITKKGSWVKGTLSAFASNTEFDSFIKTAGGWSVEAFYVNKTAGTTGIVCVTEGNGKNGKQGWGLAEYYTGGKLYPYFLTGYGANYSNMYDQRAFATDKTNLVHVVGVYDAVNMKNYVYVNGNLVKSITSGGLKSANETEKYFGFNMYNVFYIGGDPTVQTTADKCDYAASDLTVVDVRLYAGALTAEEVKTAYNMSIAPFAS